MLRARPITCYSKNSTEAVYTGLEGRTSNYGWPMVIVLWLANALHVYGPVTPLKESRQSKRFGASLSDALIRISISAIHLLSRLTCRRNSDRRRLRVEPR